MIAKKGNAFYLDAGRGLAARDFTAAKDGREKI